MMNQRIMECSPLFAGLTEKEQTMLMAGFIEDECTAEATLFKTGKQEDAIYLIRQGFVRLITEAGQLLAIVGPDSILGEATLSCATANVVTAIAQTDLQYAKLTDCSLRQMIRDHPTIGLKLCDNVRHKLPQMEEYLVVQLGCTPELKDLSSDTLQAIARYMKLCKVKAYDALQRAGEHPLGLVLLERGEIVLQPTRSVALHGAQAEDIQVLLPGNLLGTLGLLTGKPCLQDVVVTEESIIWLLAVEDFNLISAQYPELRHSLAQRVLAHLSKPDLAQAVTQLRQLPLFAGLPIEALQTIVEHLVLQHVPAGKRLYAMGEVADALYWVEGGEIALTTENASGAVEELARVGSGGYVGEHNLLRHQVRAEDATAVCDTNLWVLFTSTLNELARQVPAINEAIHTRVSSPLFAEKPTPNEDQFRPFALFADLDPTDLCQVVEFLIFTRYQAGAWIYQSGSAADRLFFLAQGHVWVQSRAGKSWRVASGALLGESALLPDQQYTSSARAETDVALWMMHRADFKLLRHRFPGLALAGDQFLRQSMAPPEHASPAVVGNDFKTPFSMAKVHPLAATRRRQTQAAPLVQRGLRQTIAHMSRATKVRFILLLSLLLWLLIAVASITWRTFATVTGISWLLNVVA